jgi:hypothetical protein
MAGERSDAAVSFTPCNTAQMGQFAERLLPGLKVRLGISGVEQDDELLGYLRKAQAETELLGGHRLDGATIQVHIESGGLPFVPTLDIQRETVHIDIDAWPIPDPIHPEFANVLQISRLKNPPRNAVPMADALMASAALLADAHRRGMIWLAPRLWFQHQARTVPAADLCRGLMDPGRQRCVRVVAGEIPGWWFQVSRRVFFVTRDTPDEPGLVEPLAPAQDGMCLVASEPILIVARVTEHPSDWVFVARVWAADVALRPDSTWRTTSQAVHAHGLPIICLDERSTPEEVVAQVLLTAYWHGYLDGEEVAAIAPALATAFPRDVARVRRGTGALDTEEAANLLFVRLLRPGFDPTQGAGSIRHYIARHASTLIRAHRTSEIEFHRWKELGISERYYYKLCAKFARKGHDGRYEMSDEVLAQMRAYLEGRQRRATALALLRERGFTDAAARKWLQRHVIDEIRDARPRSF